MNGFMPRKPKPRPDDPAESKRFIDMAREVGADESEEGREAFERAFKKIVPTKPAKIARRSPLIDACPFLGFPSRFQSAQRCRCVLDLRQRRFVARRPSVPMPRGCHLKITGLSNL